MGATVGSEGTGSAYTGSTSDPEASRSLANRAVRMAPEDRALFGAARAVTMAGDADLEVRLPFADSSDNDAIAVCGRRSAEDGRGENEVSLADEPTSCNSNPT